MTAEATNSPAAKPSSLYHLEAGSRRRKAAEKRFIGYGIAAIAAGLFFLFVLLFQIITNGAGAFTQTFIEVPVYLDAAKLDKNGGRNIEEMKKVTTFGYAPLIQNALAEQVADLGLDTELASGKDVKDMLSPSAPGQLRDYVLANPDSVGETLTFSFLASSRVDGYLKGRVSRDSIAQDKSINVAQLDLTDQLREAGVLHKGFNTNFITGSDASDLRPEQAGFGQSILGSFAMMLVVLLVCLPISVAASIYLEEFAPKNKFTDFVEINISNLAAVPSIVFGILALAAFIQFGGGTLNISAFRSSAPLVGGLALSLMTLPTIIIATRASLKAVPGSIRDAALGLGASRMQAVFHHILPLAMPGILTGTIIGLAAALGETAPLLMIGMVAFVQSQGSIGGFFTDPNVGMPAEIYIWASRADGAWYERAWGGIIILLVFLLTMNLVAIILRRKFERRW
ncbi:phosphate ABC transporter permease PstA [Salipiger sp.]|uniref:phosphate ABC transporter permease PstA n=1 Tax=Salipiger sp. TaxID=2078585 RepID=UPI003A971D8A